MNGLPRTGRLQAITERFAQVDALFNARTLRERAILGGGVAALVFFLMDATLIQPVSIALERSRAAIDRTTGDIARLESERAALERVELSDEQVELLGRKQHIMQQIAEIDARIAAKISDLVPPEAIVSVLENMLAEQAGLSLVAAKSREPNRIGSGALSDSDASVLDAAEGLYRHGLRVQIEGHYAATLEYLERVEASPWNLLWDRLEYRVKQYPTATITLDLYTISEAEEWIGV